MKIIALSLAALALLGAATAANAQNPRDRMPAGHPSASVQACVQASAVNNCQIRQNSGNNVAASVQAGRHNTTGIVQNGRGNNNASVHQMGNPLTRH